MWGSTVSCCADGPSMSQKPGAAGWGTLGARTGDRPAGEEILSFSGLTFPIMAKRGRIGVKAREVLFLLLLFQIRPFPVHEELFLPHQVTNSESCLVLYPR